MRDDVEKMSEKRPSEVLSALPRTRPHRRSEKRAGKTPGEGNGSATQEPRANRVEEPTAEAQAPASAPAKPAARRRSEAGQAQARARRRPPSPRPRRPRRKPPRATTPPAPRSARPPRSRPKPRAERLRQPPQPAGTPPKPRSRKPAPATGADIISTAVQAAAELAEIGLTRERPRAPQRRVAPAQALTLSPGDGRNPGARRAIRRGVTYTSAPFKPNGSPSAEGRRGNHLRSVRSAGANRSRKGP